MIKDYDRDRSFTNEIHLLAVEIFYPLMGYTLIENDNEELSELRDTKLAIDYQVLDNNGKTIKIQERFRRYTNNSFTLRYTRNNSQYEVERYSEFYKLKQSINSRDNKEFIMIYGVPNIDYSDFVCIAVIDLKAFYNQVKKGRVIVREDQFYDSRIEGDILIGATFKNRDSSSEMAFFNFNHIKQLFPEVIIYQKGFKVDGEGILEFATEKQIKYLGSLSKKYKNVKLRMLELLTKSEASSLINFMSENHSNILMESAEFVKNKGFRFNPVASK